MESFCGSKFWDIELTWNTVTPDFTPCFQKTVLVWIPCAFLWFFSPLEAYFLLHSSKPSLPWTWISVIKIAIAALLCVVSAAEMGRSLSLYFTDNIVFPVDYYTPFIKLVTFMLILILMLLKRKRGIHTSGVFFVFWLLLTIGAAASYWSVIVKTFDENVLNVEDEFSYITVMVYFPLVVTSFLLSCFSDSRSSSKDFSKRARKPCPEESASFLSRMTFWWFNPMAVLGFQRPLVQDDMWNLAEENQTKVLASHFDKYWKKVEKQVNAKVALVSARDLTKKQKELSKLSVLGPLMKTFWIEMFVAGVLKFAASVLTFVNPLVLDLLIAFITNEEPYWRGFLYAAMMFFSSMIESILNSQYEFRMYVVGMKMRSCVISAVYRKSLVLSSAARRTFTVGEIVNLMSVDTQRIMDYIQIWNLLWSAPLQIIIALYLLWGQLGISTLGGLAVMILMFPLNAYITVKMRSAQVSLMKAKDKRIKIMNEILNGMKILKLYAWENSFHEQINGIRKEEIKELRSQAYLSGVITFAFTSAPFLVALASFAMFVLISPDNVLDPNKAFVSLSLFNILRVPLALLPMLISFGAMFFVSLGRINKYLQGGELDEGAIKHEDFEDPIVLEDASFSWGKDELPTLRDISFQIPKGSLVAIVGSVGAGKSSLLAALLGDMEKIKGRANIHGSIAYVPQQAWIQNATLRKNILFINPYDEAKYNKVIEACALTPDLKVLSGGDMTEIGEKGINLSGGQKQRISLARAAYSDADILLLDDPLSAVDSHVGKHIFEHIIGAKGILKDKTRVLVTHRITVLPEVDNIIVMKDGTITEIGSYAELLARRGDFADFLLQFLTEQAEESDAISPEELHLVEEIVAVVGPTPELQRTLSKLSSAESDGQLSDAEMSRRRTISFRSQPSISAGDNLRRRTSSAVNQSKKDPKPIKKDLAKLTEAETSEVGSVKWKVYFDYLKAIGYLGAFITVITYIASHAFTVASSIWLSDWSNDGLDPIKASDPAQRDLRLGVYGALGAGETVFVLVASLELNLAALRGSKLLHNEMLAHILRAPMSFFDTTPLGRILNRFSKDIDTTDVTIRFNLRMLLVQFFRAVVALILISLETPIFLVAVLPLGILYYVVQKFYIATSRQLKRIESVTRSPVYVNFSETVTGVTSIRAYGAVDRFIKESNNLVDINHTSYYPSLAASRWLAIRLEFLGYSIVFLSALFAVLTRDTLSPGIVGLSVSYALTITATLNMLVRASADVETNIVSVERCLEYTVTPVEAPWYIEDRKPPIEWPSTGHIQFKNYSTRYREGLDLVLKHITCDIKPGEKVGIVGRTGAGKSSLTLSLFRLIEAADGAIVIDNVEIGKIGLHDLRSKITIIPQDPVLFTGTLRMNLDPFDTFSDEEVWTSLEQAHLKSFIVSLDAGLQYEISEGGENLSVGQRQLVCLARALLRKSKVLVLDEATAAIDLETDELIQATIRKEFADCTIVTIAHRLNTILDYNRVMVMDKGQIAEYDTPTALLQNTDSIFYSMAKDAGLV